MNLYLDDDSADRRRQLMTVNESSESHTTALPLSGDRQEILILTEQHVLKLGGAVKQRGILKPSTSVFLRREHFDPSPPNACRDGGSTWTSM